MTIRQARLRPADTLHGNELAIARSVLYASLFDYPLTLAQLRQTLIDAQLTPSQILALHSGSPVLRAAVDYRDGFFFPRGRYGLVHERRRREARSRAFLRRHRMLLRLVAALPYVRMVALSGSIAHLNLDASGDLDLFIVTRGPRVWSVTVAVVLLAKLLGRRRSVCANFVLADSRLTLDQTDLFTASQIAGLKPVVGYDTFVALLAANPFVRRIYPNFHPSRALMLLEPSWDPAPGRRSPIAAAAARLKSGLERILRAPSAMAEALCRWTYRSYLRRQAASWSSPEQVRLDDDLLKLHTRSHRRAVMDRFETAVGEALRGGWRPR